MVACLTRLPKSEAKLQVVVWRLRAAPSTESLTDWRHLSKPWLRTLWKKRASLYNTCVGYINGFQFADPLMIVRGIPPWNEESYKKVKPDTISTTMMTLAQVPLCQLLMPEVKDAIKDHLVTTGWDKAWGLYDTAYKTVTKVIKEETLAKAGIKPLELNLTEYITNEIFKELQVMMQKREGEIRADSTNKDVHKPGKPLSFAAVFSTKSLYEDDHKLWLQERVM